MSPAELTATLNTLRGVGQVRCDWRPRAKRGSSTDAERDAYVAAVNLETGDEAPRPGGWRMLSRAAARKLCLGWMRHDLAYRQPTDVAPEAVDGAVDTFFAPFGREATFVTNGADEAARTGGAEWMPKTGHTFDRGVVATDAKTIGLLWFADED